MNDPAETTVQDYSISEIMDAVSRGSSTAIAVKNLAAPDVLGQEISLSLNGSDAVLLDTSLVEHAAAVETLTRAVSDAPALRTALGRQRAHCVRHRCRRDRGQGCIASRALMPDMAVATLQTRVSRMTSRAPVRSLHCVLPASCRRVFEAGRDDDKGP